MSLLLRALLRAATVLSADLRSLGALRIALGLLIISDLGLRIAEWGTFYGLGGVLPLSAAHACNLSRTFLTLHGRFELLDMLLIGLELIAASCLVLGYRSRAAAVVCWVLLVSTQNRNPLVLNAGDRYLALLVFWSIFLPIGGAFSIDARQNTVRSSSARLVSSIAVAALYLQIAFMYLCTGLLKLGQSAWQQGDAVLIAMSKQYLTTPFGESLLRHPEHLTIATYATLVAEIGAPFLLLCPWRTAFLRLVGVLVLAFFHLGLALCIDVGLFPLISIAGLIAFLPPTAWDAIERTRVFDALERAATRVLRPLPRPTREAPPPVPSLKTQAACAVFLAFACWLALGAFWRGLGPPASVLRIAYAASFSQSWRMFVRISDGGGWFLFEGARPDRSTVDLQRGTSPASFEKPGRASSFFESTRWRKYLMNIKRRSNAACREPLARFIHQRWMETSGGRDPLTEVRLYFLRYATKKHAGSSLGYSPYDYRRPPSELPRVKRYAFFKLDNLAPLSPALHEPPAGAP